MESNGTNSIYDFFVKICPTGLWVFSALEFFLMLVFLYHYLKKNKINYFLCFLVSAGLFYDSLILSLGTFLKEGDILKILSKVRFISHGALIPFLFPITGHTVQNNSIIRKLLWLIAFILIGGGIAEGIFTELLFKNIADISRYTADEDLTPKWATIISYALSYGAVLPLIVGGIYDVFKTKSPFFLLSGLFMLIFSAIGPMIDCKDLIFFISMFGELFMMLFLFISIYRKEDIEVIRVSDVQPMIDSQLLKETDIY